VRRGKALRSKPRWLQALCRSRDPVYVVNDAQRIVSWNDGVQELLGYSEAEVLNQPCYQIIGGRICGKPWCQACCAVQRAVKRGVSIQNVEMQVRAKSGEEIWLNTSAFTIERKNERFTVHLLRNMTREENTRVALESFLDTLHAAGGTDGGQKVAGDGGVQASSVMSQSRSVARLTRREIEVLELLAKGSSTKDLAKRLGISPFTVRRHVESILLKTGLHTQAQAVAYAYRSGLL